LPQKEYVPVPGDDPRPWEVRWNTDEDFLKIVRGFGRNFVYLQMVSKALLEARSEADNAASPDKLAGIQVGIRQLKWLLTVPVQASDTLKAKEILKDPNLRKAFGEHLG
jgi:hypothetical protein